jgi:hypothetical protein
MESAYQTGKMAANRILEQEAKPTVHVYGFPEYKVSFLSRMAYKIIHIFVKVRNFLGKILTSI